MKIIKLFSILFCIIIIGCSSNKKEEVQLKKISTEKVYELIDDSSVAIIDVREKFEYEEGHLKNSILIPQGSIEDIEDYVDDKDKMIIVYCRSGRRSEAAGNVLVDMGYTNVHDMGGILSWKYEVEK